MDNFAKSETFHQGVNAGMIIAVGLSAAGIEYGIGALGVSLALYVFWYVLKNR